MKNTYIINWSKSSTWGANARLWKDNKKLFVASGCGYCKRTSCVEHAIKDSTGKYVSLGSWDNVESINNAIKDAGIKAKYSIINGMDEHIITITTK